jgi:hypothetical protein
MEVTLRASNGAKILVWREDDLFHARRAEAPLEPLQTCLGLDLFEIIADLARLDLEDGAQTAEAIELSRSAQRLLARAPGSPETAIHYQLGEDPPSTTRSSTD